MNALSPAINCAGLSSRVQADAVNEDEEGLADPPEVAEVLEELGESDHRYVAPANLA